MINAFVVHYVVHQLEPEVLSRKMKKYTALVAMRRNLRRDVANVKKLAKQFYIIYLLDHFILFFIL